MCRKVRSILQGKQGLSMILVLCMGALFAALSAALVYAASVLTANANRQLLEQEVYQLATSFSDILGEQLNDSDSGFATFINNTYMRSEYYGKNPFEEETEAKTFEAALSGDGSDGADTIKITLRRRPGEEAEKLNLNGSIGQSVDTSDTSWQQLLNSWQAADYKLVDLQLDVTVTVEKAGESFAYTVTYDRAVHYAVSYYTLDNDTTQYKWDNNKTFDAVNGGSTVTINMKHQKNLSRTLTQLIQSPSPTHAALSRNPPHRSDRYEKSTEKVSAEKPSWKCWCRLCCCLCLPPCLWYRCGMPGLCPKRQRRCGKRHINYAPGCTRYRKRRAKRSNREMSGSLWPVRKI